MLDSTMQKSGLAHLFVDAPGQVLAQFLEAIGYLSSSFLFALNVDLSPHLQSSGGIVDIVVAVVAVVIVRRIFVASFEVAGGIHALGLLLTTVFIGFL